MALKQLLIYINEPKVCQDDKTTPPLPQQKSHSFLYSADIFSFSLRIGLIFHCKMLFCSAVKSGYLSHRNLFLISIQPDRFGITVCSTAADTMGFFWLFFTQTSLSKL